MTPTTRLVVTGLVLLSGASLWRSSSLEHQKRRLEREYAEARQLLSQVESERARLHEEFLVTSEAFEGQTRVLQEAKTELDQTASRLTALQREHDALRERHVSLASELDTLRRDHQQLQAQMTSMQSLRLSMKELKPQLREQRQAALAMRTREKKAADEERLALGNRGYIVRGGVSTLAKGNSVRLHVHVLDPQSP